MNQIIRELALTIIAVNNNKIDSFSTKINRKLFKVKSMLYQKLYALSISMLKTTELLELPALKLMRVGDNEIVNEGSDKVLLILFFKMEKEKIKTVKN